MTLQGRIISAFKMGAILKAEMVLGIRLSETEVRGGGGEVKVNAA